MIMVTETNRSAIDNMVVPQKLGDEESQAVLALEGMTCASCAMRIEKGLKKVPGVKDASVNLASEQATVTYDPAQTGPEQMVQKVDAVGYKATPLVSPAAKPVQGELDKEACAIPDLEEMVPGNVA